MGKAPGRAVKCPCLALGARKALCWSSRLLQGGAAAGAAGAQSEQFGDGQGNELVDLRQGERFQNRKGGRDFSAV